VRFSNRLFFIRWLCLRDEDSGKRAEREKSYQPNAETNHRAQRNRVFRPINPTTEMNSGRRRRRFRPLGFYFGLTLPAKNCIQLTTQQQKQTGEIHPG
jgi:hypothetical protein